MPKYNCYVKMEVLCWIPDIEAEDEEEAKFFAECRTDGFIETVQWEGCQDQVHVVEIESYEQVGDAEVYKQEEEKE